MNGTVTVDVVVWWTADCGCLHAETNPSVISLACPDGVRPEPPEDEE